VDDVKKYIDFSYLIAGVLFAWLGVRFAEMIWGISPRIPNPELFFDVTLSTTLGLGIAIGITVWLRVNPKIYGWITECGVELRKTIWPGWEETKSNTVVVIIVTFILGLVLWFFDIVWQRLTGLLY